MEQRLHKAIAEVPAGRWAVGVSGGADSTALLRLLATRGDVELVVAHLNHETRGEASEGDEQFVRELASAMRVPFETTRMSQLADKLRDAPANPSAKYRHARFLFFKTIIQRHQCQGVLLAHHHDDVIETVFQRLVRGSGYGGLRGIAFEAAVQNVRVIRPLLKIERMLLRDFLRSISQRWRVDASNESDAYGRNRARKLLACHPSLKAALEDLRRSCVDLDEWVGRILPPLPSTFAARELANLPCLLGRERAGRWLMEMGVPPEAITPHVSDLLITMARDASTPPRQTFPTGITAVRRSGWITVLAPKQP